MVEQKYEKIESEVDNKNLYKKFGRENEVGKMLYGMYAQKEKPKIYYPPVKTKVRGNTPPKEEKNCPQKTVIDYPEMPRKSKFKYAPIDFVPRRKPGEEINAELETEKRKPVAGPPGKAGRDRGKMIENLQERIQFEDLDAYNKHIQMKRQAEEVQSHMPLPDKVRRQIKFKGGIA